MSANLQTYLSDHLAGAQFATSLLADLGAQTLDTDLAAFARTLLAEIEADKQVVEQILTRLDSQPSMIKEASAWFAQKLGRAKLQVGSDRFSIFEGLELLAIGILGKLSLWKALQAIPAHDNAFAILDLAQLAKRASDQHAAVEQWRITYAVSALRESASG
ncbi:MAG: hypothetical protein JNL18_25055 [Planctomycetaceae bacterium]|nr:hypothetical protein [Planctomycetaceae bacterium]